MLSMTYFDFLCNLTVLLIILFTALSYATGLFYMAELAEEFPTLTKRLVRYLVLAIAALHLLAFASALPKLPLTLGLLLHVAYLPLLATFPVLPLSSPALYAALLLLGATQLAWHLHMPTSAYAAYPSYSLSTARTYSTAQLLAFYLLFVWLVPLVLFVAGSVAGHSLPLDGERVPGGREDGGEGADGRWSCAGIGRWCRRDKGGGSDRDKKDDDRPAAQSQPSHRYEPNPAYYGSAAASPASASAPAYSTYRPEREREHEEVNGADAQWMYGPQQQQQQQQQQLTSMYGSSSSEGQWMGQRLTSASQMAVRQRSHIS